LLGVFFFGVFDLEDFAGMWMTNAISASSSLFLRQSIMFHVCSIRENRLMSGGERASEYVIRGKGSRNCEESFYRWPIDEQRMDCLITNIGFP
jgi:hypothetical protein